MWSSVDERITDGTSGLVPQGGPSVLFLGVSSKGSNSPLTLGRRSAVKELFGYGPLADAAGDCQKNMGDEVFLAQRTEADELGSVSVEGAGLSFEGNPAFGCRVELEVINSEEVILRWEGAKNLSEYVPLPENGFLLLTDLNITVQLPEDIRTGSRWVINTRAPSSSREALKKALDQALEVYTPEAVIICQNSDAEDAAFWGAQAEAYFGAEHKPVHFILASDLAPAESFDQAVSLKAAQFAKTDARFVSVLCQPGEVEEGSLRCKRQPLGLLAATIMESAVSQSIGATRWFAVRNFILPEAWRNVHSRTLDEARLITLRTYGGLNGIYWSNGRTLGGDTSDYRFLEVVRTVHKAVRLARRASLPYVQAPGDEAGIANLLAEIRSALTSMTDGRPVELLAFDVNAPEGQNISQNGVQVELSLYGVPIIRKIVLNFMFKYLAGEGS